MSSVFSERKVWKLKSESDGESPTYCCWTQLLLFTTLDASPGLTLYLWTKEMRNQKPIYFGLRACHCAFPVPYVLKTLRLFGDIISTFSHSGTSLDLLGLCLPFSSRFKIYIVSEYVVCVCVCVCVSE